MSSNMVQKLLRATTERNVEPPQAAKADTETKTKKRPAKKTKKAAKTDVTEEFSVNEIMRMQAKAMLGIDKAFRRNNNAETSVTQKRKRTLDVAEESAKKGASQLVTNSRSSIARKRVKHEPTVNKKALRENKRRKTLAGIAKRLAKAKVPKLT
jgi:hypothetical protein